MWTRIAALMFALSVFAHPALGQVGGPDENKTFSAGDVGAKIVELVKSAEGRRFTGAVLAARDGKVVAAIAVGPADLDGKAPSTPATLFEIASLSKQFTAAAVLRLEEMGKLQLDDPISKHLPGVPADCAAITIRHLMQHTSGIPGENSQGGGRDLSVVLPMFLRGGPKHKPGTHWEYWNQGYALLSEILTRASGKDYPVLCRGELFERAGMKMTCFTGDAAPKGAAVAVGRSQRGAPRSALEHPYGEYGFQYRGMGGAVSSVWDLWRWDRALRTDSVLSSKSRQALFEPGLNSYALGWFVKRGPTGRLVQSHGGGVRGFACEMRRFPKEDGCVIVLANRDDAPVREVADTVEKMLFGEPVTAAGPGGGGAIDKALVSALVGTYKDARGRKLKIIAQGDGLRGEIHWAAQGEGPVTRGTFIEEGGKVKFNDGAAAMGVEIERGADGTAKKVTIDPKMKLEFSRVE